MPSTTTRLLTAATTAAALVSLGGPAAVGAPAQPQAAAYTAPLSQAIADLPVATEQRDGYDRDLFNHWVDADGDGCDARDEVLISEADDPPDVGTGCSLTGGRWFSYYDRVSWTDPADIDIDHMVPLAEAWDSGAHGWTSGQRQMYANDLADYRTLVGVTDGVNQAKGDQDIAEWLPAYDVCRYLGEFVAVKHRFSLTVDTAEKSAMQDVASGCSDVTISVTEAW